MTAAESSLPGAASLIRRFRAGDDTAAELFFERYAERLIRLARSRLATRLASRIDPEDVVQSAYRSFFVAARQGRFAIESGGDLWRLLVEVVLHKLYRQVEHHRAKRRSVDREEVARFPDGMALDREPTASEAVAAVDELEAVLRELPVRGGQALELRLQGYEHQEIARQLGCNERSIRRWLNEAQRRIAARGGSGFVPSAARKPIESGAPSRPAPMRVPTIESPLRWSDYTLIAQIGAGATGKVYRAQLRGSSAQVAIKFLKRPLTRDPLVAERFLREAQTVAQIDHPGVVKILGAGTTPGSGLFLVMELVEGQDLSRVRLTGEVDPRDAAGWVAEAASTIDVASQRGIIHCDVKPSNLLLDLQGRVRVTDFGLALSVSESADHGLLGGTPAFMAPEQVDRCWGPISSRTDVWGLGAVLFFLLYGRPPHTGSSVADVIAQVASASAIAIPSAPDTGLPLELQTILERCLAKRPDDRFSTAGELVAALRNGVHLSDGAARSRSP